MDYVLEEDQDEHVANEEPQDFLSSPRPPYIVETRSQNGLEPVQNSEVDPFSNDLSGILEEVDGILTANVVSGTYNLSLDH